MKPVCLGSQHSQPSLLSCQSWVEEAWEPSGRQAGLEPNVPLRPHGRGQKCAVSQPGNLRSLHSGTNATVNSRVSVAS